MRKILFLSLFITLLEPAAMLCAQQGWEKTIPDKFNPKTINQVIFDESRPKAILVASNDGLFYGKENTGDYVNLFSSLSPDKRAVHTSAVIGNVIFAGTGDGLYYGNIGGKWSKAGNGLRGKIFKCITASGENIYAASEEGIFFSSDSGKNWQQLPIGRIKAVYSEAEQTATADNEEYASPGAINALSLAPAPLEILVIGADSGLYILNLREKGSSLYKISASSGIPVSALSPPAKENIIYFIGQNRLYGFNVNDKSINEINNEEVFYGLKCLIFNPDTRKHYRLDERGISEITSSPPCQRPSGESVNSFMEKITAIHGNDPGINLLREAAIQYAEVSPEKVREWRSKAATRAWLPTVSLGCDYSKGDNYEIYTSATKDYIVQGPDKYSRGYDIRLAWDLADLIYNQDQTSIDTRSRLTVELRNDILEDLNRLYFERRRLLAKSLSRKTSLDSQAQEEILLKIEELTARIDGLTNGYLSSYSAKQKFIPAEESF